MDLSIYLKRCNRAACIQRMQNTRGLGTAQQAFCNANGVCIDRHIACGCYEASQGAFQIWKSFCDQDRPFSSFTWCGRLFFCSGSFRVCNRNKQGELVPTRNFWIRFFKSDFKNTCWASPKPDIQHKITLNVHLILQRHYDPQGGWYRPALSFFAKVSLVFSCKLPKVTDSQNFLLTRPDFCGNPFQQFNITYLLRVPARLPKEPEQVFNFLIAT